MTHQPGVYVPLRALFLVLTVCKLKKMVKILKVDAHGQMPSKYHTSLVMRKPAVCICKNIDADQLRGNREADQCLCFSYTDTTIPLLPKKEF